MMSKVLTESTLPVVTLDLDELRDRIRQIVREQIPAILEELGVYAEPTVIEPGSPVHEDLVETLKMAEAGILRILTREEAFGG
jgi:hypothetical protein